TGLKQIVVNVSWPIGVSTYSFTLPSIISPPARLGNVNASTGTFRIKVCAANITNPALCDNTVDMSNAEIAIYNLSSDKNVGYALENGHGTINPPGPGWPVPADFVVPGGQGYTIHVQQYGYFPYYENRYINGGELYQVNAILRPTGSYGSKIAGEAFSKP